jgi:lysozyme
MTTSRTPLEAVLLILSYEQLRLVPYRDRAGLLTWGWGHKGRAGEAAPHQLTREQANALFLADLAEAERGALAAIAGMELDGHQLGALVSFAFNAGVTALRDSTLASKVRVLDFSGAAAEFRRWIYVTEHGRKVVSAGLVERRLAEERLWRG